ncbi:MAG: histidine kinase, partial [Myxococcaceae bacterium]|nr:histidine kinase [Myxococcaceae bacterium]
VHLTAFLLTHAACQTVVVLCGLAARPVYFTEEPLEHLWGYSLAKSVHLALIYYGVILAVGYALEYHRRFREGELAQANLQAQLAHAQLDALKMQLHPHFLFNTLNAIAVLVRKQDTADAVRMITGVGELLRLALHNTGRQTVPLRQELDFIERYLALEQMRFQDRMQVHRDLDPSLLDAAVPNLLLQPLVENAIKHGISARAAAGKLELRASRRGEWLRLEVCDDGPGLRADWDEGGGIGLANVRARLAQLYGERQVLRLEPHPEGGVRAVVELPLAMEERP